jgi:NhaP-type Na+/H+ or K+/H+ antiporter
MPVNFTVWYIIVGALLVTMALAGTLVRRLPLTASLLYLALGVALGPWGAGLIRLDAIRWAPVLERVTEVAVIVSLFTAGLKTRVPLRDGRWWLPARLASASMVVTVGLVALAGVYGLGLSWGAAILLGAILAPTDPVLASDVQLAHPGDRDRLRFGLTGEAGLNDGTAFPFVMLGLLLLGLHHRPGGLWGWLGVDVLWAVAGGILIGGVCGTIVGRFVLYLRRTHKEAVGLDEFLSLGLLALAYGLALLAHTYGFLAAFAAGVALRCVESSLSGPEQPPPDIADPRATGTPPDELATDARKAPAYMAQAVLGFNEQLERICEVAVVVLLGALLVPGYLPADALWFVPLLFLVIRPLAVLVGLAGLSRARLSSVQWRLVSWFGIRGVGSVYYLMFAVVHGLDEGTARVLAGLTLTTVAASVAVHGISVTPLMNRYSKIVERRRSAKSGPPDAREVAPADVKHDGPKLGAAGVV